MIVNLNARVTARLAEIHQTKRDLCNAIGVAPGNLLRGLQNPSMTSLIRIAEALNISIDELLFGKKETPEATEALASTAEGIVVSFNGRKYRIVEIGSDQ